MSLCLARRNIDPPPLKKRVRSYLSESTYNNGPDFLGILLREDSFGSTEKAFYPTIPILLILLFVANTNFIGTRHHRALSDVRDFMQCMLFLLDGFKILHAQCQSLMLASADISGETFSGNPVGLGYPHSTGIQKIKF